MTRQRMSRWAALASGILGFAFSVTNAEPPLSTAQRVRTPEDAILQSLRNNPITAPYSFAVKTVDRQFVLMGRVGSRQVHDVAIRSLIAMGYPVRDDLVIDTRELDRIAAQVAYPSPVGFNYLYPPPLLSRVDDPFLGFEPPIANFPPYWGAIANRAPVKLPALDIAGQGPPSVQFTVDSQGVAYLSGQVASQADKETIGAQVTSVRGIGGLVNELEVVADRPIPSDLPPPPPTPAFLPAPGPPRVMPPPVPRPDLSEGRPSVSVSDDPVTRKVVDAFVNRPVLAALRVKVSGKDGVVTLTGKVPSAYEAMQAFRAAEQTPGVREVIDRLEFAIPDDEDKNPLRLKGRPDDVEPYLTAQIRRQLGDLAHVDRVRLQGDAIEINGTVSSAADTARAEATIRSIPLLRGFRVTPNFRAD